ncbi:hypothetical protein [Shouchella tritolerans]|uniref:hypothetical protein n=1 Tax=Shouchella tritolerans TaxID=2979466 RepID=UPI0021E73E12|nr:hypothetical protein [Shouchella tritolerans]
MDSSKLAGNHMESVLEHYFFYIEQHCFLLRDMFDLAQSTPLYRKERIQLEKSFYHSLWLFNFLLDHINRLKLEKLIHPIFMEESENPRVLQFIKNIKHFLENTYKDLPNQPFIDLKYKRKCKQMLQTILNQDFLKMAAKESSADNRQASPPWVNPEYRRFNSLYKSFSALRR